MTLLNAHSMLHEKSCRKYVHSCGSLGLPVKFALNSVRSRNIRKKKRVELDVIKFDLKNL